MKNSAKAGVALLMLLGAHAVSAASIGDLSYGDSVTVEGSVNSFFVGADFDTYEFGLVDGDSFDVSFGIENLDGFSLSNGGGIVFQSGRLDGETGFSGTSFTVTDLDAGDYEFTVFSSALGFGTFDYEATVSVAQIPLPAAAWLFLSALGGLTYTARRRRQVALTA